MIASLVIMCLLIIFCGMGVWFVSDGWYSLLVHWKRDGQTFWRDHLFRFIRGAGGLLLFLGCGFILVWLFY